MKLDRRSVLLGTTAVAALGALGAMWRPLGTSVAAEGEAPAATAPFPFTLTDAEWKKKLKPLSYQVLRHEYTEQPGTSELLYEHRAGTFSCAGCDYALFDAKTKFESGTGWPSFYQPLDNAVGESTDTLLGYPRTEVHCANCGGHLGHVFDDGPEPTGLRYCMNGAALQFHAAAA
jgi:peptide-methionine (R)-S-oxide reductase